MTKEQMSKLEQGDIVRGKLSGNSYVITANYGDYVIGVRTIHISHPEEWDVVKGPEEVPFVFWFDN